MSSLCDYYFYKLQQNIQNCLMKNSEGSASSFQGRRNPYENKKKYLQLSIAVKNDKKKSGPSFSLLDNYSAHSVHHRRLHYRSIDKCRMIADNIIQ